MKIILTEPNDDRVPTSTDMQVCGGHGYTYPMLLVSDIALRGCEYSMSLPSSFILCSWPVRTLSFSHDSQLLASASEDLFIDIVSLIV